MVSERLQLPFFVCSFGPFFPSIFFSAAEATPAERKQRQRDVAARQRAAKAGAAASREGGDDDDDDDDDGSSGWETASSSDDGEVAGVAEETETEMAEVDPEAKQEEWDVCRCLFSNHVSESLEANLAHMRTSYGFVLPGGEGTGYRLTDPGGLVRYLGAKLSIGHIPLSQSGLETEGGGAGFRSLHAVQRHMVDTNHCRVLWEGNEEEYEDFYEEEEGVEEEDGEEDEGDEDEGRELAVAGGGGSAATGGRYLELVSGGLELAVRSAGGGERIIGSRELARYYKQSHAPRDTRPAVLAAEADARARGLLVGGGKGSRRAGGVSLRGRLGGAPAQVKAQQKAMMRWDRKRRTEEMATIDKFSAFLPKVRGGVGDMYSPGGCATTPRDLCASSLG